MVYGYALPHPLPYEKPKFLECLSIFTPDIVMNCGKESSFRYTLMIGYPVYKGIY